MEISDLYFSSCLTFSPFLFFSYIPRLVVGMRVQSGSSRGYKKADTIELSMQVTVNTSCASVARTIALFHFYDTFIIHTKPKLLEFKTARRTIHELHSMLKVEY